MEKNSKTIDLSSGGFEGVLRQSFEEFGDNYFDYPGSDKKGSDVMRACQSENVLSAHPAPTLPVQQPVSAPIAPPPLKAAWAGSRSHSGQIRPLRLIRGSDVGQLRRA